MQGLNTVLKHPHLCTSNINVFEVNGRRYEWYHRRLVGDVYICYDAESRDVMAMGKLRFDLRAVKQIVTAWGLRSDPPAILVVVLLVLSLCIALHQFV